MTIVVNMADPDTIDTSPRGYFELPVTITSDDHSELAQFVTGARQQLTNKVTFRVEQNQRVVTITVLGGESEHLSDHPSKDECQTLANKLRETELAKEYFIQPALIYR